MRWTVLLVVVLGCGDDGGTGNETKDAPPTGDSSMMQDSSMTADASFGPGAICGASTCMAPQVCCTGAMIACKAAADCPTQYFGCDGPEDCTGGVCCFGNGGQMGSECKSAGTNCNLACHFDTDCPTGAPKCCPKMFTPGYKVCQAAC